MSARLLVLSAFLVTAGACTPAGFGTFGPRYPDNRLDQLQPVLAAVAADSEDRPAPPSSLILATDADTPELRYVELPSGKLRWRQAARVVTRAEELGDLVLFSTSDEVVALDAQTGTRRWAAPTEGLALVGGTREGELIVYSLNVGSQGVGQRQGRIEARHAVSGKLVWRHRIQGVLGRPAAIAGHAFVPWERNSIAIVELKQGEEVARIRSTDDVLSWIRAGKGAVFYGGRGFYQLTEASVSGTRAGSTFQPPPVVDAPGDPLMHDDGFLPIPGGPSARGRIRLEYEPVRQEDGTVVPAGGHFYFVYFRYVFAFDHSNTLMWARILDGDAVAAEATAAGLVATLEDGTVQYLDARSSATLATLDVDAQVASAALEVQSWLPAPSAQDAPDLRASLAEIAVDPDNRLAPARAFAISALAALPEPAITRDLLDLYTQRSMPAALREHIAQALRGRLSGQSHLLSALRQRYDFLEGSEAPPLEIIVPALLERGAHEAVPGLVQQLMNHETPAASLSLLVTAIGELGNAAVVPALEHFLRRYHADSSFAEEPEALVATARTILKLGGPQGRETARHFASAPRTLPSLKAGIEGIFAAERSAAEAERKERLAAAERALEEASRRAQRALPRNLSTEAINAVLAMQGRGLRRCVLAALKETPKLSQVRLLFIVENDGRARGLRVTPANDGLQRCLERRLDLAVFPRFRAARQQARYTISIREGGVIDTITQPWWERARQNRIEVAAGTLPWWVRRKYVDGSARRGDAPEAMPAKGSAPGEPEAPSDATAPDAGAEDAGSTPWWAPTVDEDAAPDDGDDSEAEAPAA